MKIYVSSSVSVKLDEYVDFLIKLAIIKQKQEEGKLNTKLTNIVIQY